MLRLLHLLLLRRSGREAATKVRLEHGLLLLLRHHLLLLLHLLMILRRRRRHLLLLELLLGLSAAKVCGKCSIIRLLMGRLLPSRSLNVVTSA